MRVRGKDVDIYIYRDDPEADFVFVACATSCALHFTQEAIPIATRDSGAVEDFWPGYNGCTIDFDGVATLDEVLKWQFDEFIDGIATRQLIRFTFTDGGGSILTYEMTVMITAVDSTNGVEDFSVYNVSMVRCGAHTKTKTIGTGGGGTGGSAFLLEGGDYILTEGGDHILLEA